MKDDLGKWIFETLTGSLREEYRLPGVENAYAEGVYYMEQYCEMRNAYTNLCKRLGETEDEDKDVETIIQCYMNIEQYIGMKMYEYGVQYGRTENRWKFWKRANNFYSACHSQQRESPL